MIFVSAINAALSGAVSARLARGVRAPTPPILTTAPWVFFRDGQAALKQPDRAEHLHGEALHPLFIREG